MADMRGKEKVFTYVELDEKTSIQKLSLTDQLRVLFKRLTNDDAKELRRDDLITQQYLRLKADLIQFIEKATGPIRLGEKQRVEISLSNRFDPVLEEVLLDKKITRYYDVEIIRPNIPYDIEYFLIVRMEVK